MEIKFTKIIEEEYVVDIPLQIIEEMFNGYAEDAVENYIKNAVKIDEYVELDNVRKCGLSIEDELWQEAEDYRQIIEEDQIMADYYRDLGVI